MHTFLFLISPKFLIYFAFAGSFLWIVVDILLKPTMDHIYWNILYTKESTQHLNRSYSPFAKRNDLQSHLDNMSAEAKLSNLRNFHSYMNYVYTYYCVLFSKWKIIKHTIYIAPEIMSLAVLLHNSMKFLLVSVLVLLPFTKIRWQ